MSLRDGDKDGINVFRGWADSGGRGILDRTPAEGGNRINGIGIEDEAALPVTSQCEVTRTTSCPGYSN